MKKFEKVVIGKEGKIDPYTMGFFTGLKPLPDYTVTEWACENRILTTRSSAEAGKYSTDRTPYTKGIMDVMSPKALTLTGKPATEIVFVKGCQLGGSETLINCVGYYIDLCPCPILYMVSTVDLAKFTSTDRFDPLIEETPSILKKIGRKRAQTSENAVLKKGFAGGSLRFIGANSPVGMRSAAVRLLIMDEVSSYPATTEDGDPVELAARRADTFGESKKVLAVSTPTIEGQCKITRMFLKSDQRYFYVPCPHCKEFQKLKFQQLKWKKHSDVYYECEYCKEKILEDFHKTEMLSKGQWRATYPDRDVIGFHLNSMYSPRGWKSWEQIAKEYEEAKGNPELERVFVNNVLGEAYRIKGDAVSWEFLLKRKDLYERGKLPRGVLILTCGVDVQADRIELEIVGWGRNRESWSIDYRVLLGDTGREEVWKELAHVLDEEFQSEETGEMRRIQMTCVDSGFNTAHVYNFTRKYDPTRVIAVKGYDHLPTICAQPKHVDFQFKNKKIKNGVRLVMVGSSVLKQELYGFLRSERNEDGTYQYGYCHFPQEYGQEYFMMLTAEEYICTENEKKQKKYEWVKVRDRNEALDVRNYARAAANMLGYDRLKEADFLVLEEKYGFKDRELAETLQAQNRAVKVERVGEDYWKGRDDPNDYWKNRG